MIPEASLIDRSHDFIVISFNNLQTTFDLLQKEEHIRDVVYIYCEHSQSLRWIY